MEKNSEMHVDRWVDERLAALSPDRGWQPNTAWGLARLRERGAGTKRGHRWTWVVAVAGGTCIFLVALPVPRAIGERCLNYMCSTELWQGHSSPDRVGDDASILAVPIKDLQGRDVTLGQYKGQVVLVNFWATWCAPCLEEMPWLIDFQQKYGPRGFTVLGVSLDADGKKSVMPFIESRRFDVSNGKQALNYPILLGNNEIGEEFGGMIGLPTSMLFSRDGKKVKTVMGLMSRDEVERAIQGLL
jgi:thiol-disulfide isomerase/thioredoxin